MTVRCGWTVVTASKMHFDSRGVRVWLSCSWAHEAGIMHHTSSSSSLLFVFQFDCHSCKYRSGRHPTGRHGIHGDRVNIGWTACRRHITALDCWLASVSVLKGLSVIIFFEVWLPVRLKRVKECKDMTWICTSYCLYLSLVLGISLHF